MAGETEDDIFNNDIDPLEGIRQLRKLEESDEGVSEELNEAADEELSQKEGTSEEETADTDLEAFDEEDETEKDEVLSEKSEADDEKELPEGEEEKEELSEEKSNSKNDDDKEMSSFDLKEVRKFKADGQEYEFTVQEMLDQFGTVFGKAVNYTGKTKQLAPYRKRISAMEEENLTDEQFNLALDAIKGNKGAIRKIMQSHKIESYDLAEDDETQPAYAPTDHGLDESTQNLRDTVNSMRNDPEYNTTADVVQNQWDSNSQNQLASNPQLLAGLHSDVKSGLYAKVAPEATKLKILDGNTKSDIEYYMLAGQEYSKKQRDGAKTQSEVDSLNKKTQAAVANSDKASSEAQKRRSASNTRSRSDRTVIDYLDDDNDEAYDEWRKKLDSSH
tara:strand:- start:2858 stop:4024 length:1167 start_codon:yes stop_codon:yes gene_type:complete